MINIYEAQAANKRKSVFVVVFFVLFVALAVYFISQAIGIYLGYAPGGLGLVGIAFIISGLMSLVGYYFSDRIVLGISSARPAKRNEYFDFYTAAENLAIAAGLAKPKLYVIEDSAPNAFATGRNPKHAVICATTGLLDKLNRTELEGVIAHELSHIKNRDTLVMTVTVVLVGLVTLVADWGLRMAFSGRNDDDNKLGIIGLVIGLALIILSPVIAQLIQLAISRKREFLADASGALMTRYPEGLASALEKISGYNVPMRRANHATAHLFIASPFGDSKKEKRSFLNNLFSTHPPVEERIKALRNSGA